MADGAVYIQVEADDKEAQKQLNKLASDIRKLEAEMSKTGAKRSAIAEQLRSAQEEAIAAYNEVERLQKALADSEYKISKDYDGHLSLDEYEAEKEAQIQIKEELKQQQVFMAEKEALAQKLASQDEKILLTMEQQTAELEAHKEKAGEIQRRMIQASTESMQAFKGGKEAASQAFDDTPVNTFRASVEKAKEATDSTTAVMKKSLKTMLKYGLGIRSLYVLFNKLRSYVVEGFQNLAQYDEETNRSISQVKSALSTLKNSLATAFAPILNTIAPILTKFINMLAKAASYVSMFFAVLSGKSTYKKAVAVQEDYAASLSGTADAANAASTAVKEMEQNLSGLDEVNTWQSNDSSSSGGGSSGSGTSSSSGTLFEDAEIENTDALKERFQDILWTVGAIAAALATWKISRALGADLKTALGLAVTIGGAVEFIQGYLDAWQDGIDLSNMQNMFLGVLLVVGGLAIAFGAVEAAIGALVTGIAMVVLGCKEWIETGELSEETCAVLATGILLIGAAISVLTGSFIPLIVAGIAWLALTIYEYWDEIKAWTSEKWNSIWSFICDIWDSITSTIEGAWDKITNFFSENPIGIGIADFFTNPLGTLAELIDTAIIIPDDFGEQIKERLQGIADNIEQWWGGTWLGGVLNNLFGGTATDGSESSVDVSVNVKKGSTWVKDAFTAATVAGETVTQKVKAKVQKGGTWVKDAFSAATLKTSTITKTVKSKVSKTGSWVADAWTAAKMTAGTVTKTVQSKVQKANTWVADAWTAATATSGTVTKTVQSKVQKASTWVADAWTAATATSGTVTKTVQSKVQKASTWVADAWTAATATSGTVTKTVQSKVEKANTWVADAWTAAKATAGTVTKTVQSKVEKASTWVADAWTAAKTTAGTVTRTLEAQVKRANTWVADAWTAINTAAGNIKRTVEVSLSLTGKKLSDLVGSFTKSISLSVTWSTVTSSTLKGKIAKVLFGSYSWPSLKFAARGGIVDGATLFGGNVVAGEAGKEAIIPLENHTEWIDLVAGRIADILANVRQSADYSTIGDKLGGVSDAIYALGDKIQTLSMPVMATGTVVPPKTLWDESEMSDLITALKGLVTTSGTKSGGDATYHFIATLDGRVLFKEIINEAKLQQARTGRNPFDL
jgi:hypothetical protein